MTQEQSKAFITAITLFIAASILIITSIVIIFDLTDLDFGRRPGLYGIVMLIAGVACTGIGFNFLIKAGIKIFKNIT